MQNLICIGTNAMVRQYTCIIVKYLDTVVMYSTPTAVILFLHTRTADAAYFFTMQFSIIILTVYKHKPHVTLRFLST